MKKTKTELSVDDAAAQGQMQGVAAVAGWFGLQWAVYACGWKWEIGNATRETEQPIALFKYREHAVELCQSRWPNLGEVRPWPNT